MTRERYIGAIRTWPYLTHVFRLCEMSEVLSTTAASLGPDLLQWLVAERSYRQKYSQVP